MGLENPLHIAVLLLVVFLVFGAKRLPEFGRSLGSGLREFRSGVTQSVAPPPTAPSGSTPDQTDTLARSIEPSAS